MGKNECLVEVFTVFGVNPETGQVVRIPMYVDVPELAPGKERVHDA